MNERTEQMPEGSESTAHAARTAPAFAIWGVVGLVAGLFLAFFGVFGSYEYSLGLRLALWVPAGLLVSLVAFLLESLLSRTPLGRSQPALRWLFFVAVFALVITPLAYGTNALLGSPSLSDIVMYFQNSILLSALFCGGRLIVERLLAARPLPTPPGQDSDRLSEQSDGVAGAFRARLPARLQAGQLIAVSSEGHYVRVHTDLGSDLILLRLKDAMLELAEEDGLQVHRGWWVARKAVHQAQRADGRWMLKLQNGVTVPVSRKRASALRNAGWV